MPEYTEKIVWDVSGAVSGIQSLHETVTKVSKTLEALTFQSATFRDGMVSASRAIQAEVAKLTADLEKMLGLMSQASHYTAQQGGWTQGRANPTPGGPGGRPYTPYGFPGTYPPPPPPANEYGLGGGFGYGQGLAMLQGAQPFNMVGGHGDPQGAARRAAQIRDAELDAEAYAKIANEEKKALGFANRAAVDAAAAAEAFAAAEAISFTGRTKPEGMGGAGANFIEADEDAKNPAASFRRKYAAYVRDSQGYAAYIKHLQVLDDARREDPLYGDTPRSLADLRSSYFPGAPGGDPTRDTFNSALDNQLRAEQQRQLQATVGRQDYDQWRLQEAERLRIAEATAQAQSSLARNASRYDAQDRLRFAANDPVSQANLFDNRASLGQGPTESLNAELAAAERRVLAQADLRATAARYAAQDRARYAANDPVSQVNLLNGQQGQTTYDVMRAQLAASAANAAAQPVNLQGLTGPAYAYGLGQNVNQANQTQAAAFQALQQAQATGQGVPQAQAAFQQAAQAAQGLTAQQQALVQSTQAVSTSQTQAASSGRSFGQQLLTQASYAAGAILIYGGLRAAQEQLNNAMQQGLAMQDTAVRVGLINGQSAQGTTNDFVQAARYGIGPSQAAAGLVTAAQANSTDADKELARQMTLIFGADQYNNILQELEQTKRRLAAAGQDNIDVEDYMATAYKTVTRSVEDYGDAIQLGAELQGVLGLGADRAGLAILNITKSTEQSPQIVANMIERVRLYIEDPKNQKALKALGITGTDTPSFMRAIAADIAGNVGNVDRQDQVLSALVSSSGTQAPQTLAALRQIFTELDVSLNGTQQPLADFTTLIDGLADSLTVSTNEFKATWDLFLGSLTLSLANSPLGRLALNGLQSTSAGMQVQVETSRAQLGFSMFSENQQKQILDRYIASHPNSGLEGLANSSIGERQAIGLATGQVNAGYGAFTTQDSRGSLARLLSTGTLDVSDQAAQLFLQWLQRMLDGTSSDNANAADSARWNGLAGTYAPPAVGTSRGSRAPALPISEFGGFQTLEKGMDWNKLLTDIKKYEDQLAKEVPGYEQDPQTYAFYDESKKYFRTATGDAQAIRMAVEEQRDLMKQVTGLFNVPAGGEVLIPFAALEAGLGPDYGGGSTGGGGGQTSAGGGKASRIGSSRSSKAAGTSGKLGALTPPGWTDYSDYYTERQNRVGGDTYQKMQNPDYGQAMADGLRQLSVAVHVTLNNRVTISGKTIVDTQSQEMANALGSVRRGGGGAGAQALAM